MAEVVSEMDYLRAREQKLRDTNESTNTRVKWFGFMTTFLLIALWAWQIMYLRAYFRWVQPMTAASRPNANSRQVKASYLMRRFGECDLDDGTDWCLGVGVLRALAWRYSQSGDAGEHGIMRDISGVLYMVYILAKSGNGLGLVLVTNYSCDLFNCKQLGDGIMAHPTKL